MECSSGKLVYLFAKYIIVSTDLTPSCSNLPSPLIHNFTEVEYNKSYILSQIPNAVFPTLGYAEDSDDKPIFFLQKLEKSTYLTYHTCDSMKSLAGKIEVDSAVWFTQVIGISALHAYMDLISLDAHLPF